MTNTTYQNLQVNNTVTAENVTAQTVTAQNLVAEALSGTAYNNLIELINAKLSATSNVSNIGGSWLKLSNGIIFQFGTVSAVSSDTGTISFPTAFSEYIYSIVAVCNNVYSADTVITLTCSAAAPASFTYYITRTPGVSTEQSQDFWWIAIGV